MPSRQYSQISEKIELINIKPAVKSPNTLMALRSERYKEEKPIKVVRIIKNKGLRFSLIAFPMLSNSQAV